MGVSEAVLGSRLKVWKTTGLRTPGTVASANPSHALSDIWCARLRIGVVKSS